MSIVMSRPTSWTESVSGCCGILHDTRQNTYIDFDWFVSSDVGEVVLCHQKAFGMVVYQNQRPWQALRLGGGRSRLGIGR
jgi:hypothetical protein